jgi:hypothetical protein
MHYLYTAKTLNELKHTCKNHQACSHINSNTFRNPQSIRFQWQNRSLAVDIQIRDISNECLILVLYVDDLFLTGSESLIVECKRALISEFEMKDLGMKHYFLGLEVWQRTDEIFPSQGKYIVEILKKFGMTDCKSMPTPMAMDLKKMNEASTDLGEIDPHLYR